MKQLFSFILLCNFFVLSLFANVSSNKKEQIIAVIASNYHPISFISETGKPDGFAVDILNKIAENSNLEVKYVVKDTFSEALKALNNKEVDVFPSIYITDERKKNFIFTTSTNISQVKAFKRKTSKNIKSLDDIKDLKVTVPNTHRVKLMKNHPKELLLIKNGDDDCFDSLLSKESDVWVYNLERYNYNKKQNKKYEKIVPFGEAIANYPRGIAVQKEKLKLATKLNLALINFKNTKEYIKLYNDWIGDVKSNELTLTEKNYLKNNSFTLCPRVNHYPLSDIRNNQLVGIGGDIFKEINKNLNLRHTLLSSKTQKELYENISTNKCDVIVTLKYNQTKFKNVDTISPIFEASWSSVSNIKSSYIDNFTNYEKVTFYVKEPFHTNIVNEKYPNLKIKVEKDIDKLFEILKKNDNAHFLTISISAEYFVQKYGVRDFKISGNFNKIKAQASIGINKNHPFLLSAMNKEFKNIDQKKITDIIQKFEVKEYKIISYQWLWYVVGVLGLIGIILQYRYIKILKEKQKEEEGFSKKLKNLNESLEIKVKEQVKDIRQKDILLLEQSKLASMGEMLGAIAHQWRQPLNVINGTLINISDAYIFKELTAEYMNSQVDIANDNIKYLSQTIDDFRSFTNPKKEIKEFYINESFEKVKNIILPQLERNNISLVMNIEDDIKVVGSVNELEQCIINLINNSKDALLTKLFKDDEKSKIEIQCVQREEKVYINIIDNGSGIDEDNKERIFEPYFTTKEKLGGSGIGLYLCKSIIEKTFNGTLSLKESRYGYTCFEILLNCAK